MDTDIKPEEGMVAFLDILGYTSFLINNEPEEAAETILPHLLGAPENVDKFYESTFKESEHKPTIKDHVNHIKWMIFSDTILLTNAYEPGDSEKDKASRWYYFLITLIILYRQLFDNGLPVRGGVSHGKFLVVQGRCFAGRSIIAAFQLANNLDLAAVALDQSVRKELEKIKGAPNISGINLLVLDYLVATKSQPPQKMDVLIPTMPKLGPLDFSDIRQVVAESFWKNKKDLGPDVISKLENTELFFRFARMRKPNLFSEMKV